MLQLLYKPSIFRNDVLLGAIFLLIFRVAFGSRIYFRSGYSACNWSLDYDGKERRVEKQ